MFFTVIGVGVFCYGVFYSILLCLLDCDLQLAFYEKFGKSVRRLQGKVVFITGASSGIGEHTAIALAKHGIKLVLTARRQAELERVKQICITSSGGKLTNNDVLVLPMDLLDFNSHKKVFDLAVQHFGQIDILFNNAGRSQRANWEHIDMTVDKELFDLDVFSVINLTRIAIKYFSTKGYGHVAVNSSIAGVVGAPYSGTYCGAKHAIHGYYNSLRTEKLGTDLQLTVSVICPGPTFSNFLQESFTGTAGQKYGNTTVSTDRRMTGERCGQLCAVTLANKINECWLGVFPLIPFVYVAVYFPVIRDIVLKVFGPKRLFKLRDSKDIDLSEVQAI
ncbi:hypothetical protein ILUMI_17142 [Ignelater luminosus]|uniref:Dehydrogenase/reductase SDR family member 7 n=1 Tax=Ignelater luminosus TaxID=2038154 RepID=A0A8K0CPY9_IGNLU|nr:hypothetical protein ILUMI_17142 [Ignelater luminosus]